MTNSIQFEPMTYKQTTINQQQELITKLRIIREVKRHGKKQIEVALQFHCHRNTIGNILKLFSTQLPEPLQKAILYANNWNQQDILAVLYPLVNLSRRPHNHPAQAKHKEEDKVVEIFKKDKLKVGPQRFHTLVQRRFTDTRDPIEQAVAQLGIGSLKGIFKRNQLQIEKVKTANGQRQPLYDYTKIGCFEHMHYDVKHVLDKKALPISIYQSFADNKELPLYQWTLQDAKSRFRFLAYSRGLNAEFGLKYLLFALSFIRWTFGNWEQTVRIGMDNGVEFCSGSETKEIKWNQILSGLNAQIYTYHAGHDIRKNLIERSHRTDDRELYVPRGIYMETLPKYMDEAKKYMHYFNFERPHSGIEMHDRTSYEVIQNSGLTNGKRLLQFPVIVLEDEIKTLRQATDQLLLFAEIQQQQRKLEKNTIDQKKLIDLSLKYDFFETNFAQNLLTHYRNLKKFLISNF